MSARDRLAEELKGLFQAGLFFTVWLGGLVVLLLEKAFEGRHEYGGFARKSP